MKNLQELYVKRLYEEEERKFKEFKKAIESEKKLPRDYLVGLLEDYNNSRDKFYESLSGMGVLKIKDPELKKNLKERRDRGGQKKTISRLG